MMVMNVVSQSLTVHFSVVSTHKNPRRLSIKIPGDINMLWCFNGSLIFCPCASTIHTLGFVYKIGNTDCVHGVGLAGMCSPLYSTHLVKGSDNVDHPNESHARESIYSPLVAGYKAVVSQFIVSQGQRIRYSRNLFFIKLVQSHQLCMRKLADVASLVHDL